MGQAGRNPCSVEREKLGVAHLTRGHREFAMNVVDFIVAPSGDIRIIEESDTILIDFWKKIGIEVGVIDKDLPKNDCN
jgi:hypothetical protein